MEEIYPGVGWWLRLKEMKRKGNKDEWNETEATEIHTSPQKHGEKGRLIQKTGGNIAKRKQRWMKWDGSDGNPHCPSKTWRKREIDPKNWRKWSEKEIRMNEMRRKRRKSSLGWRSVSSLYLFHESSHFVEGLGHFFPVHDAGLDDVVQLIRKKKKKIFHPSKVNLRLRLLTYLEDDHSSGKIAVKIVHVGTDTHTVHPVAVRWNTRGGE